jgi:hypothetical protein
MKTNEEINLMIARIEGRCMPYTIQEIHVPNGTIVKQYSLDGE